MKADAAPAVAARAAPVFAAVDDIADLRPGPLISAKKEEPAPPPPAMFALPPQQPRWSNETADASSDDESANEQPNDDDDDEMADVSSQETPTDLIAAFAKTDCVLTGVLVSIDAGDDAEPQSEADETDEPEPEYEPEAEEEEEEEIPLFPE
jgi:hypothetical protein